MAVANTWTTGHSVPIHQLRPSLPSFSSTSTSTSTSTTTSSSSSSSISFSDRGFLGKNKRSAAVRVQRRVLSVRNQKNSRFYCLCTSTGADNSLGINFGRNGDDSVSSASEWDWNRWSRHFTEIEQADICASLLKFQLEDAIEKEDFEEAAKLKTAIMEATSKDSISAIMCQLKDAINEERYHDASKLCRDTGSGLVGWWFGYSKDSTDSFGKIVRITPEIGRFIGKTYSPRQLITASPGTPLFEIFVVKDADENYTMQVVFLQQVKSNSSNSSSSDSKLIKILSAVELDNASVVSEKEAEKSDEKNIDIEDPAEEGIKKVINFLKDKIPEMKAKAMKLNIAEEVAEESDSVKQFMEEDKETTVSSDNEEASNMESIKPEQIDAEELSDSDDEEFSNSDNEEDLDTKFFVGGVSHNKGESSPKDEHVRIPAEIRDIEKDSFVLHIPKRIKNNDAEKNIASKIKIVAVAAQGVSELMPPEVAKASWSSDKVSPKVSRDVREIFKRAFNLAQKHNKLSKYTNFSRITTSKGNLDPFDGLYIGSFGPYGFEIVHLRRKYGNWNVDDAEKSSDMEFFEYVEAVKLTGDLNVPAGQVTFRAKIGKGSRLPGRGMYPDELGVVAGYKGQGRIAEFGFRNPQWIEGELLQLNGKAKSPYARGAELGFLYVVHQQSFLVLFNRLKLPD